MVVGWTGKGGDVVGERACLEQRACFGNKNKNLKMRNIKLRMTVDGEGVWPHLRSLVSSLIFTSW